MSRRAQSWILAAALCAVLPPGAQPGAVEYVIKPSIDTRVGYDDNLRFTGDDELESFGYKLSPRVRIDANSGRWQVGFDATLPFIRFEEDEFNTDDQKGTLSIGHLTPTRQLQLIASIDRESLRTSEVDSTGIVGTSRQERVGLRPVGYWQLNALNSLTVGASFSNVHYNSLIFDDYKNTSVDITWSHQLSERMIVDVIAFGSDYRSTAYTDPFVSACTGPTGSLGTNEFVFLGGPVNGDRDSTTLGLEVGLRRTVSESLEWSLAVGQREVDGDLDQLVCVGERINFFTVIGGVSSFGASDTDSGFTGRTSIKYSGRKLSLEAQYEQSITPAGLGFQLDTKRVDANLSYGLREDLDLTLAAVWSDSESVAEEDNYSRDFWSLLGSVKWKLNERWSVALGARAREQDAVFLRSTANAASYFFDLKYAHKPIRISR